MSAFDIQIVKHDTDAYEQALALRQRILRDPLGLTINKAELASEKDHIHVVGFARGKLVATLELVPQGVTLKMRQVAVEPSVQGQGLGSLLVAFAETHASTEGFEAITLHARLAAAPFYDRLGYVREGEVFEEVSIPHIKMSKRL